MLIVVINSWLWSLFSLLWMSKFVQWSSNWLNFGSFWYSGNDFCEECARIFTEFTANTIKKTALLADSALRRAPATSYTCSFQRLHGHFCNPMVSLFANGLSGCCWYSVHGQHRGLLAARHTCGRQFRSVWKRERESERAREQETIRMSYRLVPCTRHYVLLCGRYSRYAVFLNCFLNSLLCLCGFPLSGW